MFELRVGFQLRICDVHCRHIVNVGVEFMYVLTFLAEFPLFLFDFTHFSFSLMSNLCFHHFLSFVLLFFGVLKLCPHFD